MKIGMVNLFAWGYQHLKQKNSWFEINQEFDLLLE